MTIRYPFPTAAHTYFRAINKHAQKQAFIEGTLEQPEFTYKKHWTQTLIQERLKITKNDKTATGRLKLVASSLALRDNILEVENFRAANAELFHLPSRELAEAIISRMSDNCAESDTELWSEVLRLLDIKVLNHTSIEPADALFQKYRDYLKHYTTLPVIGMDIIEALEAQLEQTGLTDKGWTIKRIPGAEHAHTHHQTKTITIGESYAPRSLSAVQRITIHEVIGHAVRGPQQKLDESEGFAIILEQLTKRSFAFRRTYRYLAVALGWGVFGKRMTFREVYEILWRMMVIHSKYTKDTAKQHAFDECYRAFRGGRPDVAGAVFLKDAVYFDANIRMWAVLDMNELSYTEFIDIIEGRRTVLS
jgi:hypothetical protein